MRNIKLLLAYDGTSYLGWQKTKEGRSIEEELEKALEQILQHSVYLQAASRTDAGVHAYGQVVNFLTPHIPDKLQHRLNCLLPSSIVIREAKEADPHFHPTLDCKEKEYHYWISRGAYQLPFQQLYAWHVHAPLDLDRIQNAAQTLIGTHDFAAFTNVKKNETYTDTVREVTNITLYEKPSNQLQITLSGNHFLYKMARNLVGTLIYAGLGKLHPADLPQILAQRDRTLAGVTAPAHGLFLHEVRYD